MSKVSEPWSNRQQRQLSYISEFTTDIQHIQGKDNPVADSLSRATLDSVQLGIDYSVMAADQKDDPEIQAYLTTPTSLLFKEVPFGQQGITLLCDTFTGQARPVVPVSWRRKVFDLIHGLESHFLQIHLERYEFTSGELGEDMRPMSKLKDPHAHQESFGNIQCAPSSV